MKAQKSNKSSSFRKHWTEEEDQGILSLVGDGENIKWNIVAQQLADLLGLVGRSGKQCRERWHNHLDPRLVKSSWTAEEQHILFTYHKRYGNTWAQIGSYLNGRSENAIKNQFYSTLRRQFKKWKGCEPTRSQLKKHDSVLTSQILSSLNKRIVLRNKEKREDSTVKTLDDLDPVETSPIDWFGTRDQDCFDCLLYTSDAADE